MSIGWRSFKMIKPVFIWLFLPPPMPPLFPVAWINGFDPSLSTPFSKCEGRDSFLLFSLSHSLSPCFMLKPFRFYEEWNLAFHLFCMSVFPRNDRWSTRSERKIHAGSTRRWWRRRRGATARPVPRLFHDGVWRDVRFVSHLDRIALDPHLYPLA